MARTVSSKKLEANRRNAQLSTGPRTDAGKAAVSHNALKHGLLARDVVVTQGAQPEDAAEFNDLLQGLLDHHQPVGTQEEMLVYDIAACYWRQRRALRYEKGEIQQQRATAELSEFLRQSRAAMVAYRFAPLLDQAVQDLWANPVGMQALVRLLDVAIQELDAKGELAQFTVEQLRTTFGQRLQLEAVTAETNKAEPAAPGNGNPSGAEDREIALRQVLEDERDRLRQAHQVLQETDQARLAGLMNSLSLPRSNSLEKLLRYETTINRQLYRALSQLERLQRLRRGEHVPPAIRLEFAG